jgi:pilus assembly protein CpaC
VFALDEQGAPLLQRDVEVSHDLARLQRTLREQFPRSQPRLTSTTGSVALEGVADSPQETEAIAAIAAGAVGQGEILINRLTLSAPVQVHLRVRVAEV